MPTQWDPMDPNAEFGWPPGGEEDYTVGDLASIPGRAESRQDLYARAAQGLGLDVAQVQSIWETKWGPGGDVGRPSYDLWSMLETHVRETQFGGGAIGVPGVSMWQYQHAGGTRQQMMKGRVAVPEGGEIMPGYMQYGEWQYPHQSLGLGVSSAGELSAGGLLEEKASKIVKLSRQASGTQEHMGIMSGLAPPDLGFSRASMAAENERMQTARIFVSFSQDLPEGGSAYDPKHWGHLEKPVLARIRIPESAPVTSIVQPGTEFSGQERKEFFAGHVGKAYSQYESMEVLAAGVIPMTSDEPADRGHQMLLVQMRGHMREGGPLAMKWGGFKGGGQAMPVASLFGDVADPVGDILTGGQYPEHSPERITGWVQARNVEEMAATHTRGMTPEQQKAIYGRTVEKWDPDLAEVWEEKILKPGMQEHWLQPRAFNVNDPRTQERLKLGALVETERIDEHTIMARQRVIGIALNLGVQQQAVWEHQKGRVPFELMGEISRTHPEMAEYYSTLSRGRQRTLANIGGAAMFNVGQAPDYQTQAIADQPWAGLMTQAAERLREQGVEDPYKALPGQLGGALMMEMGKGMGKGQGLMFEKPGGGQVAMPNPAAVEAYLSGTAVEGQRFGLPQAYTGLLETYQKMREGRATEKQYGAALTKAQEQLTKVTSSAGFMDRMLGWDVGSRALTGGRVAPTEGLPMHRFTAGREWLEQHMQFEPGITGKERSRAVRDVMSGKEDLSVMAFRQPVSLGGVQTRSTLRYMGPTEAEKALKISPEEYEERYGGAVGVHPTWGAVSQFGDFDVDPWGFLQATVVERDPEGGTRFRQLASREMTERDVLSLARQDIGGELGKDVEKIRAVQDVQSAIQWSEERHVRVTPDELTEMSIQREVEKKAQGRVYNFAERQLGWGLKAAAERAEGKDAMSLRVAAEEMGKYYLGAQSRGKSLAEGKEAATGFDRLLDLYSSASTASGGGISGGKGIYYKGQGGMVGEAFTAISEMGELSARSKATMLMTPSLPGFERLEEIMTETTGMKGGAKRGRLLSEAIGIVLPEKPQDFAQWAERGVLGKILGGATMKRGVAEATEYPEGRVTRSGGVRRYTPSEEDIALGGAGEAGQGMLQLRYHGKLGERPLEENVAKMQAILGTGRLPEAETAKLRGILEAMNVGGAVPPSVAALTPEPRRPLAGLATSKEEVWEGFAVRDDPGAGAGTEAWWNYIRGRASTGAVALHATPRANLPGISERGLEAKTTRMLPDTPAIFAAHTPQTAQEWAAGRAKILGVDPSEMAILAVSYRPEDVIGLSGVTAHEVALSNAKVLGEYDVSTGKLSPLEAAARPRARARRAVQQQMWRRRGGLGGRAGVTVEDIARERAGGQLTMRPGPVAAATTTPTPSTPSLSTTAPAPSEVIGDLWTEATQRLTGVLGGIDPSAAEAPAAMAAIAQRSLGGRDVEGGPTLMRQQLNALIGAHPERAAAAQQTWEAVVRSTGMTMGQFGETRGHQYKQFLEQRAAGGGGAASGGGPQFPAGMGGGGESGTGWMRFKRAGGVEQVSGGWTPAGGITNQQKAIIGAMEKYEDGLSKRATQLQEELVAGKSLSKESQRTATVLQAYHQQMTQAVQAAQAADQTDVQKMAQGAVSQLEAMGMPQIGAQAQVQQQLMGMGVIQPGGRGAARAGQAFRSVFSGWEMMRMRRMWQMTGAPVFQQMIPAAAKAEATAWQASVRMGGFQPGMAPGGVAGGVMAQQAAQRQGMIEAGRTGYRAWGWSMGAMGGLKQAQAMFGPAVGVGAIAGSVAGMAAPMIAPGAVAGMGAAGIAGTVALPVAAVVATVLGAAALGSTAASMADPTAENAMTLAQAKEEGGVSGWWQRGMTRWGMRMEGAGEGRLPTRQALGLTPTASLGAGRAGIEARMQQQEQRGEDLWARPLAEMSAEDRMAALNKAAAKLQKEGGGVWELMDEGQIAGLAGEFAGYRPDMTAEQIAAGGVEGLEQAAVTGRSPAVFAGMAQQMGMAPGSEQMLARIAAQEGPVAFERYQRRQQQYQGMRRWHEPEELFKMVRPTRGRPTRVAGGWQAGAEVAPELGRMGYQEQRAYQTYLGTAQMMAGRGMEMPAWEPGMMDEAQAAAGQRWGQMQIGAIQKWGVSPGQVQQWQAPQGAQQEWGAGQLLSGDRWAVSRAGMELGAPEVVTKEPWGTPMGTTIPLANLGAGQAQAALQLQIGTRQATQRMGQARTTGQWIGGWAASSMWGIRDRMRDVRRKAAGAGAGRQIESINARMAFMMGPGGTALDPAEGGLWFAQDQQRQMGWAGTMGGPSPYTGQQFVGRFGWQQRRMEMGAQQFGQRWQLSRNIFETRVGQRQVREGWQIQDLSVQQERAGTRRGWTREDWDYSRGRAGMQFGWQMEDYEENIRFATGRQRKQLMRGRERAAITYDMETGRMDVQEERQKQTWKWEDEDFDKRRTRFETQKQWASELDELQRERFDMQRQHHDESLTLQKAQAEEQKVIYVENFEAQKEMVDMQRVFQIEQLERSKAAAGAGAAAAKEMAALNDEMENAQRNQKVLFSDSQRQTVIFMNTFQGSFIKAVIAIVDAVGGDSSGLFYTPLPVPPGVPPLREPGPTPGRRGR